MRVLVTSSYYKPAYVYGGPTRSLAGMCEAMAACGAAVTVYTTNANGPTRLAVPLSQPVDVGGARVSYFPLRFSGLGWFFAPGQGRALSATIGSFDVVLIDSIWGYQLVATARACLAAGVPYVVSVHGQLFDWSLNTKRLKKAPYLRWVARPLLARAGALHCTDDVERAAVDRLRLGPPAIVVPNVVNTARFERMPARGALRRELGIPDKAVVLLFLGRLTRIKRPDIAIEALSAVRDANPNAHLIVAGPDQDGLTDALKARAERLGCLTHTHFAGLLDSAKVLTAMADADMLVAPSEVQENFGMAAAEALSAGLPVLASDTIPVSRWVEQWRAGRAVPCSVQEFRREAARMAAVPVELAAMGRRAKEQAHATFSASAAASQMLANLERISQPRRRAPLSG